MKIYLKEEFYGKPASPKMSLRNVLKSLFDAAGYNETFLIQLDHRADIAYECIMNGQVMFTEQRFEAHNDILNEIAQLHIVDNEYIINSYYEHYDEEKQLEGLVKELQKGSKGKTE